MSVNTITIIMIISDQVSSPQIAVNALPNALNVLYALKLINVIFRCETARKKQLLLSANGNYFV